MPAHVRTEIDRNPLDNFGNYILPATLMAKGSDLRSISEFNSELADRIALLILVGLAVDILAAFAEDRDWRIGLTILANMLIAGGVWGELWFLKRARFADDGLVAEATKAAGDANERAAAFEKEAQELRAANLKLGATIAPRSLTAAQRASIADSLAEFTGQPVRVTSYALDPEGAQLGVQILNVLSDAGIQGQNGLLSEMPLGGLATGVWISGTNAALASALVKQFSEVDSLGVVEGSPPPTRGPMRQLLPRAETVATIFIAAKPIADT